MNRISSLSDFPDELFVLICRYLSPCDILYSFYTPDQPEQRFHQIIFDYYTTIRFDRLTNQQYFYLIDLFRHSNDLFRPTNLILSNEHISHLIHRFFHSICSNKLETIFDRLTSIELVDCSQQDLHFFTQFSSSFRSMQHISIRTRISNQYQTEDLSIRTENQSILKLLFDETHNNSISSFKIHINHGLILSKSLTAISTIRSVDLSLKSFDDLVILLNNLLPNVEQMIVHLLRPNFNEQIRFEPKICSKLLDFQLFDHYTELTFDHLKFIFNFMPNLSKLTLSLRQTDDYRFCQGSQIESLFANFLPNLQLFLYTITHRVTPQTLIDEFHRYSIEKIFYFDHENAYTIHLYSIPWPSNSNDHRQIPTDCHRSHLTVKSNQQTHISISNQQDFVDLQLIYPAARQLTTNLLINRQLPMKIKKLILTQNQNFYLFNQFIQTSIEQLILDFRLTNSNEIESLHRQFPNVKYLKLNLSINELCLKTIFDLKQENLRRKYFDRLINLSIQFDDRLANFLYSESSFIDWIYEKTHFKFYQHAFHLDFTFRNLSIWF